MKELINKTIIKVEIGSGNKDYDETNVYLVFTCDDGSKIAYYAEGDCCSTSWFAHVTGIQNLIGHTVKSIIEREERVPTKVELSEGEYEVLKVYGYVLQAWEGPCYVEFRNDSNGYYGGSCKLATLDTSVDLKEVKEDF